jgi:hypothetical protein
VANKVLLSNSLRMRLLEPVSVTVFEREVPTLPFSGSLLLEILLSHHVQLSGVGNFASRGACSPTFSPISYAARSSAVLP